MNSNKRFNKP
jgi:hypothetical protein